MINIIRVLIGIFGLVIGCMLTVKMIQKNKKIDTESIAIVKEIIDLGRSSGEKVYAIKYDVKSSEPFELIETPCKKKRKIGTERSIFYEKADPKNNFYFQTLGQFDKRLVIPFLVMAAGVSIIVTTIASLFTL